MIPLFTVVGGFGALNETSPVGFPPVDVTVAERVTVWPCVIVTAVVAPLIFVVVVVVLKAPMAAAHAVARFVALIEPRPVAMS